MEALINLILLLIAGLQAGPHHYLLLYYLFTKILEELNVVHLTSLI